MEFQFTGKDWAGHSTWSKNQQAGWCFMISWSAVGSRLWSAEGFLPVDQWRSGHIQPPSLHPTQASSGSLPLFFYPRVNSDQHDIVFNYRAVLRVCNRVWVKRIPQSGRSCHRQGHRWPHLNCSQSLHSTPNRECPIEGLRSTEIIFWLEIQWWSPWLVLQNKKLRLGKLVLGDMFPIHLPSEYPKTANSTL